MAFTKATFDYLDSGGLIKWITTAKTTAFTAVSGEGYLVDTTSAAVTVTLPASPNAGDEIIIVDYASNAGTNNITLDPGTLNLRGATDDLVLSTNNQSARLLYSGATKGWLVTTEAGAGTAAAVTPDLTVDYLVVAGGGGAGTLAGGGGGAGGLRTSYGSTTGGGGSAESSLTLDTSTNYTVTVGSGGAGSTQDGSEILAQSGSNSVFATITSTGGGLGQHASAGASGGSGGGGGYNATTGDGGAAVTSPVVQGYAGGNGKLGPVSGAYPCGGGGGASAAGANASGSSGGDGGDGLAVGITGSSVTYAGGGGGSGTTIGLGGAGGGGNGGQIFSGTTAVSGTANTGGGGGGGRTAGGSGGSGIVVIRYSNYYDVTVGSGLTTGVLNSPVGSNEKYTTFTAGTGSITFGAA